MRAILLAAGRGRRLAGDGPKCLLEIGGKTLLERHIANMIPAGIDALTVVVGYQREKIDEALEHLAPKLPVEVVYNPEFVRGSIVSLHCAADRLADGGIWMDADVLYPSELLRRLVASPHANCVLLDGGSEETGEEMMLGTRGGRVLAIARRVGPDWDVAGESVGFAKVGPAGAVVLRRFLDEEVSAGRLDQEYEAAMDRAFREAVFGFERVDDLAWTEIDFQEDVVKAERLAESLG
jgi:choline kinase